MKTRPATYTLWTCPVHACRATYEAALPATAVACSDPYRKHPRRVVAMRPTIDTAPRSDDGAL